MTGGRRRGPGLGSPAVVLAVVAVLPVVAVGAGGVPAREPPNGSGGMDVELVPNGSVVNGNPDRLPPGCDSVAGTRSVTVRAGGEYADPGEAFGYGKDRIRVEPCTRLRVTLVNEDPVRHQWMVHGLPRETYPMGMFTIGVRHEGRVTGTFVVPGTDRRLHVHCSVPQHQQKGMHATVVVGDPSPMNGSFGTVDPPGSGDGDGGGGDGGGGGAPMPGFGPVVAGVAVGLALALVRRR